MTAIVDSDLAAHPPLPDAPGARRARLRRVGTFADLGPGELGLLVDANGHLALVAGEGSAGHWLNVVAGELVMLVW